MRQLPSLCLLFDLGGSPKLTLKPRAVSPWLENKEGIFCEARRKGRRNQEKWHLELFCCVRTVALLFLYVAWPCPLSTATGAYTVTCNQCWFGAKDETPLLLPTTFKWGDQELWQPPFVIKVGQTSYSRRKTLFLETSNTLPCFVTGLIQCQWSQLVTAQGFLLVQRVTPDPCLYPLMKLEAAQCSTHSVFINFFLNNFYINYRCWNDHIKVRVHLNTAKWKKLLRQAVCDNIIIVWLKIWAEGCWGWNWCAGGHKEEQRADLWMSWKRT